MDHYADDLAALTEQLDLHDTIHIGHSTGGGEVTGYLGRHGESRVAKAVANPGGLPKEVFDGFRCRWRPGAQRSTGNDLKKITVPVLVMHGDDDQIVPYADSGPLSAKLLQNGILKTYPGFPHGMPTTEADTINADLLAFLTS